MAKKVYRKKYNYYDETGKRRCKTFSAPTKAVLNALIDEWEETHLEDGRPVVSVSEALQRYLDAKYAVLSPSTIRSYEGIKKNHFHDIGGRSIKSLTNAEVQRWVSDLYSSGLSAKTVKNCYGFLTAALTMQDDSIRFKVQLPQAKVYDGYCPSDADIAVLIEQIKRDGDKELLRSVLLSAFAPARRSEVCCLLDTDVQGNIVTINKALVKDSTGKWVVKQPKTIDSTRKVVYPDFVIKELQGIKGRLIPHTPDYIGDKFRKALKRSGLPYFRYHDLRHYGASIMMYMGISQKTIEARGGWASNSPVLKRIYQNKIEEEQRRETELINNRFEEKFAK